jgi:hypothetical protein
MIRNGITIGLSFLSMLGMAACGSSASDDPLADSWSATSCYGSSSKPADVESCYTELTLGDDLTVELKAEQISLAATASNPGCTTTWRITGQQWSTDHVTETLTVTGKGATTVERAGCINEANDKEAAATSDLSIAEGSGTYTINENSLAIESGPLKGTYTR